MADPDLEKSIKVTQDGLGKFVKKPPLTDKNLLRPPFRFLHDIVMTVIGNTGFLNGVFTPQEMDSNNVTSREGKTEFLRKLIAAIKDATGEDVQVKISKILSGQEPDKTNQLLQSMARSIEKSGGLSKSKKAAVSKPNVPDQKVASKTVVEKKPEPKPGPSKTDTKNVATKKGVTPVSKNPPPKQTDAKGKKKVGGNSVEIEKPQVSERISGSKKESTRPKGNRNDLEEPPMSNPLPLDSVNSGGDDTNKTNKSVSNAGRVSSTLKRQGSTVSKGQLNEIAEKPSISTKPSQSLDDLQKADENGIEHEEQIELHNDFKNSSMNPNMETLTLPISPIVPDASAVKFGFSDTTNKMDNHEDVSTFSSSLDGKTEVVDASRSGTENLETRRGHAVQNEEFRSTTAASRNRPETGNTRLNTARPPSARPAPPRPKSSLFKEHEESNYRPPTGKVSNVMLDSSDTADDDDNFVVREAKVSQIQGLDDLDEAPELTLTGGMRHSDDQVDDIHPSQRGLLVNQILETQKELEDKETDKANPEFAADRFKSRETSKAEIERLKNLLQDCARNANPLGKLLDYVRGDIDAMQNEVGKWREESRFLDAELEKTKIATEAALQPLQQQLIEVEVQIADKEDAITAAKMSILRHQERIEKILSGLDRVQSSHGKISIPSASQLMQGDVKLKIEDNDGDRDNYQNGFGSALNRLSTSGSGIRVPISLFTASEDLDPDNFDPWKT